MTMLLWVQRCQWRNWAKAHLFELFVLLLVLSYLWLWFFSQLRQPLTKNLLTFCLLFSLPVAWAGYRLIPPPEWSLAQPIHPKTLMTFCWLKTGTIWMLLLTALLSSLAVIAIQEAPPVLIVIALNILLGLASATLEIAGEQIGWAWFGKIWRRWAAVSICLFGVVVLLIAFGAAIFYSEQSVQVMEAKIAEWHQIALRWTETPVGTVALLPLMPTYYALKAIEEGITIRTLLWLVLLAAITAITVWQALRVAAPFCEVAFLRQEQRQQLERMGVKGHPTLSHAKPLSSATGFGYGRIALLWLCWLYWRRQHSLVGNALIIAWVLFGAFILWKWGFTEVPVVVLIFFMPVLISLVQTLPFTLPEWLKSQPLRSDDFLLMLSLPGLILSVALSIILLLTFALAPIKDINLAQAIALALVLPALGSFGGLIRFLDEVGCFILFLSIFFLAWLLLSWLPRWLAIVLITWLLAAFLYAWARVKWARSL